MLSFLNKFTTFRDIGIKDKINIRDKLQEEVNANGNLYKEIKYTHGLDIEDFIQVLGNKESFKQKCLIPHYKMYNILKEFKSEYTKNSFCVNYALYENFALYSPDVVFVDTEYNPIAKCDVLTCAAPNAKVARKNYNVDTEDIEYAMRQRIDFVLSTAEAQGVKTFILGAFGCGVFENDPTFVSQTFKHLLDTKDYGFEKVIFAIPGGPNLKAFQKTFYTKY